MPTVVIDCFPESAARYGDGHAIVAVDVIRATTTAVTAVLAGHRVYPAATIEAAVPLAAQLDSPLLVGELGGSLPYGFHCNNSPVGVAAADPGQPMILLSTSGTRLIVESHYVACLRNWEATARWVAGHDRHVAVIGAGARGQFREEDELCCAWIAGGLVDAGYEPWDERTVETIERWRNAPVDALAAGPSAEYLRATGQDDDLAFILGHVNDVDAVFAYEDGQVVQVQPR